MDIQSEKLNLIKWLAEVNEPSVIESFIKLKKEQQEDWWDVITAEEKKEIENGIAQADAGETIPHARVMEKYDQWRTK